MNNSLWTTLKQTFLEGEKGSMKAVSAFISMLLICFLTIFPTIREQEIDHAMILELIGFVCVLYGIKTYQAVNIGKKENQPSQIPPTP